MVRVFQNGKPKVLKSAKGKELGKNAKSKIEETETEEVKKDPQSGWKIYTLMGIVLGKDKQKNRIGIYAGGYFWRLDVKIETKGKTNIDTIFVGKEKLKDPQIWEDIESDDWFGRKFLFYCTKSPIKYSNSYWLLDWKKS